MILLLLVFSWIVFLYMFLVVPSWGLGYLMLHWGISPACGYSRIVSYRFFVTLCGARLALRVYLYVSIHALAMKFHLGSLYPSDSHTMLNENKCPLHGILFHGCSCSMMFHLHIFTVFAFAPLSPLILGFPKLRFTLSSILIVEALFLSRCRLGPFFPCTLSRGTPSLVLHSPLVHSREFFFFLLFVRVSSVLFSSHQCYFSTATKMGKI